MASCSGIEIKSGDSSKVYLKGSITGLGFFKEYCLLYIGSSGWTNLPNSRLNYTYFRQHPSFNLDVNGCYVPIDGIQSDGSFSIRIYEVSGNCENIVEILCLKDLKYATPPSKHAVYFWVRDGDDNPVNHAKITCAGESFYTDSDGKVIRLYDTGYKYHAQCYAPTGYECTNCYKSFDLDSDKFINFYMKPPEEEKPECTEGDKKPDKVCVGGEWEDALCEEGTYTTDRKKICRGGVWEDVSAEVPPAPECTEGYTKPGYVCRGGKWVPVGEEPEVRKYLTVAEANERVRMGLPCYIKCVLPILDMLPGIPYTPGAWVPPFCAITGEP